MLRATRTRVQQHDRHGHTKKRHKRWEVECRRFTSVKRSPSPSGMKETETDRRVECRCYHRCDAIASPSLAKSRVPMFRLQRTPSPEGDECLEVFDQMKSRVQLLSSLWCNRHPLIANVQRSEVHVEGGGDGGGKPKNLRPLSFCTKMATTTCKMTAPPRRPDNTTPPHTSTTSVSSWDRSSNFGALALRSWGSPGQM